MVPRQTRPWTVGVCFASFLWMTTPVILSFFLRGVASMSTTTASSLRVASAATSSSSQSAGVVAARIAIIGSGAAGLAAARVLTRNNNNNNNWDVTVLEKNANIGGVWNYNQKNTTHYNNNDKATPMYAGLRTNLPKEIMAFREFPWPTTVTTAASADTTEADNDDAPQPPQSSFVTHYQVQEYLLQYRHHFQLNSFIHTNCCVTQLTCLPQTTSRLSPPHETAWPQIRLDWIDSSNQEQQQQPKHQSAVFDAVLVCNGHYHRPAYPDIPGLQELLQQQLQQPPRAAAAAAADGRVTTTNHLLWHSMAYDTPDRFVDQTVLCVGGRASGADLAREISRVARHVYLSDTSTQGQRHTHGRVTRVPATQAILQNDDDELQQQQQQQHGMSVRLVDQTHITDLDTIIFCTGYEYDFPFINAQSNLELETTGRRVRPLYEQLWHAVSPNVAFVGLPHSVVPFPLFELQVEAVVRSWSWCRAGGGSEGPRGILPNLADRRKAAEHDAHSGGAGKEHGRVPEDTHYLGPQQWHYCRRMARYSGVWHEPQQPSVPDFLATQEAIYNDVSAARTSEFPGGPDMYRSLCYRRLDEQQSFERWMVSERASSSSSSSHGAADATVITTDSS